LEKGSAEPVMELVVKDGKTFLHINDYEKLRALIATLLAEVQRIKSEGDYEAARELVERYGVRVDACLHQEIFSRYEQLHLAPYKGFLNPVMTPVYNDQGEIVDIQLDYTESYTSQMLRYSKEYGFL
jgi:dipeptidyl-peptidase-3